MPLPPSHKMILRKLGKLRRITVATQARKPQRITAAIPGRVIGIVSTFGRKGKDKNGKFVFERKTIKLVQMRQKRTVTQAFPTCYASSQKRNSRSLST
ncbi:MAG: hypothetical protein IIU42_06140, partial [Ruminococcus sp.]|nr:hypothetical protein [Ruminococcus sp.]